MTNAVDWNSIIMGDNTEYHPHEYTHMQSKNQQKNISL